MIFYKKMDCFHCGRQMDGPTYDYESVGCSPHYPHRRPRIIYYRMWSCPYCMHLEFEAISFPPKPKPWRIS